MLWNVSTQTKSDLADEESSPTDEIHDLANQLLIIEMVSKDWLYSSRNLKRNKEAIT